jgi:hypothetical protein
LVDPNYDPPQQAESLPIVGNGVVALAVVNVAGPAPILRAPKILNFSGYEWTTSAGPNFRAGSRNFFDPANVWTDEKGVVPPRFCQYEVAHAETKWRLQDVSQIGFGHPERQFFHLIPQALNQVTTKSRAVRPSGSCWRDLSPTGAFSAGSATNHRRRQSSLEDRRKR